MDLKTDATYSRCRLSIHGKHYPEFCVSLSFHASFPDKIQWIITEGNPSYSSETNPQVYLTGDGGYSITLIVSNADGSDTLSKIISIYRDCPIVIPNIFTPNQDGVNDTFEIGALPQNSRLHIYDRWGLLVFESTNYNNEWKGEDELSAVYFYILETPDGKRMKGNILVLND